MAGVATGYPLVLEQQQNPLELDPILVHINLDLYTCRNLDVGLVLTGFANQSSQSLKNQLNS